MRPTSGRGGQKHGPFQAVAANMWLEAADGRGSSVLLGHRKREIKIHRDRYKDRDRWSGLGKGGSCQTKLCEQICACIQ